LSGDGHEHRQPCSREGRAIIFTPSEAISLLIGSTVGEVERALVVQTLACCDGNRTRAARMLGLSVRTLRNKIRLYSAEGIEVPAHTEVPGPPAQLEAT